MHFGIKGRSAGPDESYLEIIADELNVKKVTFAQDMEPFIRYRFKPQLRTLGPKYGKLVPKITAALNADPSASMEGLRKGLLTFDIEGTPVELTMDDVLAETVQKDGYMALSEKGMTVVLNTSLTEALIEEGYVRELVSKLQTMRREAGFEVMDRIYVNYAEGTPLSGVFERNGNAIAAEVLADAITEGLPPEGGYAKEWLINDIKIVLWVDRRL
jgi:isoleucyl-tRNA synthetase